MAMNKWMSAIDPELLLKDIIMPGSHDAGMSYENVTPTGILTGGVIGLAGIAGLGVGGVGANYGFKQLGCTHDLDILGQCNAGSRFFDVRLTRTFGRTITHHTAGDSYTVGGTTGQTGLAILNDVYKFLSDNDSEFVILRISHTYDRETAEIFIKELTNHNLASKSMLCTDNGNLVNKTIGQLRGRAIIIFEEALFFKKTDKKSALMYQSDQIYRGFHTFRQVKDDDVKDKFYKTSSTLQKERVKLQNAIASFKEDVCGIMTCGNYSNSSDIKEVMKGQKKKIEAHKTHAGKGYKPHLFVISWTQTGGSVRNHTLAENGTHKKLPELCKVLLDDYETTDWPQVISMDFIDDIVCSQIVELNHLKKVINYQKDRQRRRLL